MGEQVATHPGPGTQKEVIRSLPLSSASFCVVSSFSLTEERFLDAENSNHHLSRSRKFQRTIIGPASVTCPHNSNHCGLKDRALWLARLWSHAHTCGSVEQSSVSDSPTRATRYRKMDIFLKKGSTRREGRKEKQTDETIGTYLIIQCSGIPWRTLNLLTVSPGLIKMEKRIYRYSHIWVSTHRQKSEERPRERSKIYQSALPHREISAFRGAELKPELMNASKKAHFFQGHSGQVEERLINTAKPWRTQDESCCYHLALTEHLPRAA